NTLNTKITAIIIKIKQLYALEDKTVKLYNLSIACQQPTIPYQYNILGKLMMRRSNTVTRLRINDIVLIDRVTCVVTNVTEIGQIKRNMKLSSRTNLKSRDIM
ncbi:2492_t:CDS:1, partial [Acaulospora morrowiae]